MHATSKGGAIMFCRLAVGMTLAVLVGCGSPTKSPDGGNGGCGPDEVTVVADGVSTVNSCFFGSTLSPTFASGFGLKGNNLVLRTAASKSAYGSDSNGIAIAVSSTCSFVAGQTIQLTNPCLFVAGGAIGDCTPGSPSANLTGVLNTCFPDFDVNYPNPPTYPNGLAPDCDPLVMSDMAGTLSTGSASFTSGSLTLNQWSPTPGGTVSVTISGTITAVDIVESMGASRLVYSSAAVSGSMSVTLTAD
jgi:hypothetical protein